MTEFNDARVESAFKATLNSHGYGFQYGLAAELQRQFRRGLPWKVEAVEVPVEVQGYATRIDFVLGSNSRPVWIASECKRANPALSNWCFATAPAELRGNSTDVLVERLRFVGAGRNSTLSSGETAGSTPNQYDVALEVKGGEKGESHSSGRGAIEDAMTQVMRGVNGLVGLANADRSLIFGTGPFIITAAIFTTARLWASDVALGKSNLATGDANFDDTTFVRRPWLAYRYRLTPNLRHQFPSDVGAVDMHGVVERDFVRTVFVVAPEGITEFLTWAATGIG